jgi:hypothetical protein
MFDNEIGFGNYGSRRECAARWPLVMKILDFVGDVLLGTYH